MDFPSYKNNNGFNEHQNKYRTLKDISTFKYMQITHKNLSTFIILSRNLTLHIWLPKSTWSLSSPSSHVNKYLMGCLSA